MQGEGESGAQGSERVGRKGVREWGARGERVGRKGESGGRLGCVRVEWGSRGESGCERERERDGKVGGGGGWGVCE